MDTPTPLTLTPLTELGDPTEAIRLYRGAEPETAGIVVIELHRPDKRNAMNPTMHREMVATLRNLVRYNGLRVVIIRGAGGTFCAGMDLQEFFSIRDAGSAEFDEMYDLAAQWRGPLMWKLPVPVIAAVNGYCVGGGIAIVGAADIAVAGEGSTFCLSEINFKFLTGGPVPEVLARTIDERSTLYYGLTGEPFSGIEAARIGLVTKAVPDTDVEGEAIRIAQIIASKDADAVRITREVLRGTRQISNWSLALEYALSKQRELTEIQGGKWKEEGIESFLRGETKPGANR